MGFTVAVSFPVTVEFPEAFEFAIVDVVEFPVTVEFPEPEEFFIPVDFPGEFPIDVIVEFPSEEFPGDNFTRVGGFSNRTTVTFGNRIELGSYFKHFSSVSKTGSRSTTL